MTTSSNDCKMTADEFIAWAMERPETEHCELIEGKITSMRRPWVGLVRGRWKACRTLEAAVEAAGLRCEVFISGMALQVDDETVYIPDALLRCGKRLEDDAVKITDLLIVVDVVAPGSHKADTSNMLLDYARLPTLQHYLIVNTVRRHVLWYGRDEDELRLRSVLRPGDIMHLTPTDLMVEVADFFEDQARRLDQIRPGVIR